MRRLLRAEATTRLPPATPVQEGGATGSAASQCELDVAEEDAAFARALQVIFDTSEDEELMAQPAARHTARVPGQPAEDEPAGGSLWTYL